VTPRGGVVRAERPDGAAGARVRARRQGLGITQAELARQVGVSRQTVITLETGDYAPSVFLALRVARSLSTSVEELWGDPENDAGPVREDRPGAG
jgi:putative transcriptional regulator